MPPGYTVEYGGQFENLRSARQRLTIVIPIALVLIFFLLYFAFHSVRDAFLIYTAIPLSAVGGVMLLYIRGMPFSISASIGFIALFGVAVLNGIVLIEHFKELKSQGMKDIHRRIIDGTKHRMRPVLLTASAAAMGFLPMAISTNVGAEVQRPLATVVIGGLISATILTLLVLPVLYAIVERRSARRARMKTPMTILLLILGTIGLNAQNTPTPVSLDEAIALALENNQGIRASSQRINQSKILENSAFDVKKTEVYYNLDQSNLAENGFPLHVWGVNQSFEFPTIYKARRQVLESNTLLSQDQLALHRRMLTKEVSQAYYTVLFWRKSTEHYQRLDSLYRRFALAATRRYESGETNQLERVAAENKQQEVNLLLTQSLANAQALFESGQIDFLQYIQLMDQAQQIERNYLDHVYRYNQQVLEANYLIE